MEYIKCLLCGSNRQTKLFKAPGDPVEEFGYFQVVKCNQCGIVFTNPRPTKKEIEKFYSQKYYGEENKRFWALFEKGIELFRDKRIKDIKKFKSGGRILDIGCGRGKMLIKLEKKGWQVYGTELSERSAFFALEKLGLNIFTGDFIKAGYPSDFFDCITMWHILEHLDDPVAVMKEVHRIIKSDGVLVIAVPNYGGLQAVISRSEWFHLDVPRHYFHYSRSSLKKLLNDFDFTIMDEKHFSFEYDPFGLLQSLLNLAHFHHNLLYTLLKSKEARANSFKRYKLQVLAMIPLLPILGILCLGISILSSWMRAGGTMVVYSRKR